MSKTIKLIKAIPSADSQSTIDEIKMKDEDKICAYDFYDVEMPASGNIPLKAFEPAICNLCGLTSEQVAQMHIKDYMSLTGEVGKYFL